MEIKISLAQMDVRFGDPAANFAAVTRMTEEAKRRGSDLILFPELWSTAYDLTRASRYASSLTSGLFADLSALAQRTGIHILGSTLSLLGENQFGNTLTVFAPDGTLLADYSKIHLFRLMDEHQYLTAGDNPLAARDWRSATICASLNCSVAMLSRARRWYSCLPNGRIRASSTGRRW
jgi:omega-amidase